MKYLIIILLLTSCGQVFHMKRFIKKGGTIDYIERTITLTDTIKGADGKDSIVFRDLIVPCPDPVIETRWKTKINLRFDNMRFKDSLRFVKRMYSDSLKSAFKSTRIESRIVKNKDKQETKQVKAKWNVWLILIGLVCGYVLPKIVQRLWRKLK